MDTKNHAQLENVRVELRTFTGATVGAMFTRVGGDFEFLRVGVGSYDIVVQQAGYHSSTLRVDVDQAHSRPYHRPRSNSGDERIVSGPSRFCSRAFHPSQSP